MKKIIYFTIIGIISIFNYSCRENYEFVVEPDRAEKVNTYADLFDRFWNVMNSSYNYFYEEKETRGLDWDAVYDEYHPKFSALKTFGDKDADKRVVLEELNKAALYYYEITSPLLDKHFFVWIGFDIPSIYTEIYYARFSSGLKKEHIENLPYNYTRSKLIVLNRDNIVKVMKDKLIRDEEGFIDIRRGPLSGYLKSDPDVYYFTFPSFRLFGSEIYTDKEATLVDVEDMEVLKPDISLYDYPLIKDASLRDYIRKGTNSMLEIRFEGIKKFVVSKTYQDYLKAWSDFKKDEKIEPLYQNRKALLMKIDELNREYEEKSEEVFRGIKNNFENVSTDDLSEAVRIYGRARSDLREFRRTINQETFENALRNILGGDAYPLYKNFYNKLTDGSIKKLILDLRGNRGGALLDARYFIERLVTKEAIWGYQRTKEGNGRFNYTPWIESRTKPHPFAISKPIPIVILTNKISGSMSENCTMMLKSQGDHVKSVGDYSAGATAGFGLDDDFNGGYQGSSATYLYFGIPLLAFKDASGNLIEGKGVKPDIHIVLTEEEIKNFNENKASDIAFEAALHEIKKMN